MGGQLLFKCLILDTYGGGVRLREAYNFIWSWYFIPFKSYLDHRLSFNTIYSAETTFWRCGVGEWEVDAAEISTMEGLTFLEDFFSFFSGVKQHKVWEKKENKERDKSHCKTTNSSAKTKITTKNLSLWNKRKHVWTTFISCSLYNM